MNEHTTENDIQIVELENFVLIKVPLYVPKVLYQNGAINTLAKSDGWTETVIVTGVDENNMPTQTEVPNPKTPLVFNAEKIQQDKKDRFFEIMKNQGAETGRQQAEEQFNQLFNIYI